LKDDKGFITLKGPAEGFSRPEFEYEIPEKDAETLLNNFCDLLSVR
jgi:CYTH domain-containing protein